MPIIFNTVVKILFIYAIGWYEYKKSLFAFSYWMYLTRLHATMYVFWHCRQSTVCARNAPYASRVVIFSFLFITYVYNEFTTLFAFHFAFRRFRSQITTEVTIVTAMCTFHTLTEIVNLKHGLIGTEVNKNLRIFRNEMRHHVRRTNELKCNVTMSDFRLVKRIQLSLLLFGSFVFGFASHSFYWLAALCAPYIFILKKEEVIYIQPRISLYAIR